MKISYNWLKQLINIELPLEEVCDKLTMSGLEVEHVIETESIKGGLKNLIVGEVMSKTKHPNADSLNLTTVDIGTEGLLSIVCGAKNVAVGQKVVVAPIGTIIHTGTDNFQIKKAKIKLTICYRSSKLSFWQYNRDLFLKMPLTNSRRGHP